MVYCIFGHIPLHLLAADIWEIFLNFSFSFIARLRWKMVPASRIFRVWFRNREMESRKWKMQANRARRMDKGKVWRIKVATIWCSRSV